MTKLHLPFILWYVKGYKLPSREIRTLAIHRIMMAELGENSFELDQKLLAETQKNGLFTYPKIEGVTLRCDAPHSACQPEQSLSFKTTNISDDFQSASPINKYLKMNLRTPRAFRSQRICIVEGEHL